MKEKLQTVSRHLLEENLGAQTRETLLIVIDTETSSIGRALFDAGRDLDLNVGVLETPPLERSGTEPPAYVSAAMAEADIVVAPTQASLTHTRAREAATESGARVATMPGVTERMFRQGAVSADYEQVEHLTAAVTERLTEATEARIETAAGSLTMSLDGRDGIASDGIIRKSGTAGNLPSGEGYIAPVEDTASGIISFNGSLAGMGKLEELLVIQIEDGFVTNVEGAAADTFLDATDGGDCARRVGELGIGTNPAADVIGTVLEDEKVYGTCHVAFGDNRGFGGTIECDSHLDGIVLEPTVSLDNKEIVRDGEVLV